MNDNALVVERSASPAAAPPGIGHRSPLLSMLGGAAPLFAALASIALLGFGVREGVVSPFILAVVLALAGFGLVRLTSARSEARALSRLFVTVFSVNLIVAVVLYLLLEARYGVPFLIGGTDDRAFHEAGLMLYERGALTPAAARDELLGVASYIGYPLVVAWTYAFGDAIGHLHTMLPRVFNCFMGGLLALLVYRVARAAAYRPGVALGAAYFAGLYPFLVFHNALILRDTIIAVLILTTLYAAMGLELSWRGAVRAAVVVACVVLLLDFRDASAALVVLSLLVIGLTESVRRSIVARIAAVAVAGIVVVFLFDQLAYWYARGALYQQAYLELMGTRSAADSLGMALLGLPFPFDLVARLLLGLMWPLPVLAGDPAEVFKNAGALVWYPLVPFVVRGWIRAFSSHRARPAAVTALLFFLGVSLVTMAFRHMTQFVPILVIFGIAEFSRGSMQRLLWLSAGFLACGLGLAAYAVLKF